MGWLFFLFLYRVPHTEENTQGQPLTNPSTHSHRQTHFELVAQDVTPLDLAGWEVDVWDLGATEWSTQTHNSMFCSPIGREGKWYSGAERPCFCSWSRRSGKLTSQATGVATALILTDKRWECRGARCCQTLSLAGTVPRDAVIGPRCVYIQIGAVRGHIHRSWWWREGNLTSKTFRTLNGFNSYLIHTHRHTYIHAYTQTHTRFLKFSGMGVQNSVNTERERGREWEWSD